VSTKISYSVNMLLLRILLYNHLLFQYLMLSKQHIINIKKHHQVIVIKQLLK